MVKLLSKKEGDADACGAHGFKPVLSALSKGHEGIAISLFERMNDPDVQIAGDAGYTPLHAACLRRWPKSARVFISAGAAVHRRTSKGSTPLHLALKRNFWDESCGDYQERTLQLIVLLFESGANRDTKACRLGILHPDSKIRDMFRDKQSLSPQEMTSIRIGRCWADPSIEDTYTLPRHLAGLCRRPRQHFGDFRNGRDSTIATTDLCDKEFVPMIGCFNGVAKATFSIRWMGSLKSEGDQGQHVNENEV